MGIILNITCMQIFKHSKQMWEHDGMNVRQKKKANYGVTDINSSLMHTADLLVTFATLSFITVKI